MKDDLTERANAAAQIKEMSGHVADPFAVDLFSVKRAPATAGDDAAAPMESAAQEQPAAPVEVGPWHARLPRITAQQARLSSAMAALPPSLPARFRAVLERFLSHYTHTAKEAAAVTLVDLREAELSAVARRADAAPRLFLSLVIEPHAARCAFEMEAGFVAAIIDRVLGGEGVAPQSLRALSRIELTVAEFLFLSLLREFNLETGEPLLKAESLGNVAPPWLSTKSADEAGQDEHAQAPDTDVHDSRGLILTVRLRVAEVMGLARLYLPSGTLASLDSARNPLLFDAEANTLAARLTKYKKIVTLVRLSLLVGETAITTSDLAQLERGDVIIIERPRARWSNGRFAGDVQLRAGAGFNLLVTGSPVIDARETVAEIEGKKSFLNETIKLRVGTISTAKARTKAERMRMEEEKDAMESAPKLGALDELLVTLRVELATQRLSLDELSGLRAGQILDLGCLATDPVDLLTEEKLIARGELVDIEGRLGVRITHVVGLSNP